MKFAGSDSQAAVNLTLLHIIPDHVFLNTSQGSYKDVSARVAQFETAHTEYMQVRVGSDSPDYVIEEAVRLRPSRIFIEYSYFPRILEALRRLYPKATIAVRAHNIEPLQNISDRGISRFQQLPQTLYGSLRLLGADILVRRYADAVYAISDWEIDNYWKRIPGRAGLHWLPYCTPRSLVPERFDERRDLILCLPNSSVNRKTHDLVSRFCTFAELASHLRSDLKCAITQSPSKWGLACPDEVAVLGFQENLKALMPKVLAVAVLSPRGFGFKTTIMDAIAAGAWVLTAPKLLRRIPSRVKPCCIAVDPLDSTGVGLALQKISTSSPDASLNDDLRREAMGLLQRHFLNGEMSPTKVDRPGIE